jgi:3-isopropylmalate dehydrogenase
VLRGGFAVLICYDSVDSLGARGGNALKIGILLGDDIGLVVVPECVKVMKAAASATGLAIDWHPLPIG